MANLKTWKRGSMTNVIGEATRELDEYKNNVDEERTHLNYHLIEGSETRAKIIEKVNTRVHDVMGDKIKPQTRKNMKPLGTWVVTLPQELNGLSDEEQRDFFETALEFVGARYGKENLVYAAVHMDENQPHMHVGVVPVCTSRKTGKETVSSASMFTKKDLKTFHDDLDALMETKYGKARLMKNGRTKGNYTLDELKERTRNEEDLAKRTAEVDAKSKEIEAVQWEIVNTVGSAVQALKIEKPKVEAQKAKNEADAKKVVEKQGQLQTYKQQLVTWRDDQVKQLNERKALLDEKEERLNEREDKLAEREAETEARAQEASERLREASERLEEAKATESRVKAMLDEIKARAGDIVDKVRDTVSKWAGRVRRKNSEALTAYYNERTDKLADDVETTLTSEDLKDVTERVDEDVTLYDSDLQGLFDNDLTL